ncbi:hypothetical protein T265_14664, partial [Opisthorchis viverrini]
ATCIIDHSPTTQRAQFPKGLSLHLCPLLTVVRRASVAQHMTSNYNALKNRNLSVQHSLDSDYHRMVFHSSSSPNLVEESRRSFGAKRVRLSKNDVGSDFCGSGFSDLRLNLNEMPSDTKQLIVDGKEPVDVSISSISGRARFLTPTKASAHSSSLPSCSEPTNRPTVALEFRGETGIGNDHEYATPSRAKRICTTNPSPRYSQSTSWGKQEKITNSSLFSSKKSLVPVSEERPIHILQKSFTTTAIAQIGPTRQNAAYTSGRCIFSGLTQSRSSSGAVMPTVFMNSQQKSFDGRDDIPSVRPKNHEHSQKVSRNIRTPSSAPSPTSSYTGSLTRAVEFECEPTHKARRKLHMYTDPVTQTTEGAIGPNSMAVCSSEAQIVSCAPESVPAEPGCPPVDNALIYVPGMALLMNEIDATPIDLISKFEKTPVSSPAGLRSESNHSVTLLNDPSFSQLPNVMDSNIAQRPASSAHTSPVSPRSAGREANKASKNRYAQMRRQLRKRMEQDNRQPLPALHLHLSKDGTSPLPPGWQRAPNVKQQNPSGLDNGSGGDDTDGLYAYYYYHVRTRQTRWDPPVYPWDADPEDTLTGGNGDDDPEAPYNWGCASKYSVSHEEIEAMYNRLRQRILERQCTELLHELADKPDAPKGAVEQGFAIELFTLVHDVLRNYRDARCKVGRILNDEDLYYLTRKLAQAVIMKEVQKWRSDQAACSSSLFASAPIPELTASVNARVSAYVKRYMESKGAFYRRRVQQGPIPPVSSQKLQLVAHAKPEGATNHHHHHLQYTHSTQNTLPLRPRGGQTHFPHMVSKALDNPSGSRSYITPPKPVPNVSTGPDRNLQI